MSNISKPILIVCRKAPYRSSLAREAIDIALAAAAFDQPLSLLFSGDGVYQLMKEQNSEAIVSKNLGKVLTALPLYGIDSLYADDSALRLRGLEIEDLLLPVQLLDTQKIKDLMANHAILINI
ncbi:MAG: tRNA 2-thiouridine synthesizing protein C [Paraglaciecola psychrophila]|jgi:tRNA 2-thiouridine synthesizing protein C